MVLFITMLVLTIIFFQRKKFSKIRLSEKNRGPITGQKADHVTFFGNPKLIRNFPRFEKNQSFFWEEIFVISLLILNLFRIISISIVISDFFGNFGFFGKSQVLSLLSCDWFPVFFAQPHSMQYFSNTSSLMPITSGFSVLIINLYLYPDD